jgi:type II secretory pathway pseudopilin PulG
MVSLAVVGFVSALAIPAVMNNVQEARILALLKENTTLLSQVVREGADTGELYPGVSNANAFDFFTRKLNVSQKAAAPATSCTGNWGAGASGYAGCTTLRNGAVASFYPLAEGGNGWGWLYLDANGASNPNVDGQDRMALCFYYGNDPTGYTHATAGLYQIGELHPCDNHAAAAATALGAANSNYTKLWAGQG